MDTIWTNNKEDKMRACNCTLPTVYGQDVCKNCGANTEVNMNKLNELKQIIDDYFKNITPEQLKEDLIRNGMKVAPVKYQPTTMPKEDIDKFVKILEECGAEIKPTPFTLEEKCEYCEVDVDDRKILLKSEQGDYTDYLIYIDGNGNLTDETTDKKINYCPMCGRKL